MLHGLGEQHLRILKTLLLLTNDTQAAQGIGIIRITLKSLVEQALGPAQITTFQRIERRRQQCTGRDWGRAGAAHLPTDTLIARYLLQVATK